MKQSKAIYSRKQVEKYIKDRMKSHIPHNEDTVTIGEMANVLGVVYLKAWRTIQRKEVLAWKPGKEWVVCRQSLQEHMLRINNQTSSSSSSSGQ